MLRVEKKREKGENILLKEVHNEQIQNPTHISLNYVVALIDFPSSFLVSQQIIALILA